jgi:predicted glycosyltransferase
VNYLRIWIDILTPKQLLFFRPMATNLRKKHKLLCTTREYGEVKPLIKIHNFDLKIVGKYGEENFDKLKCYTDRIQKFIPMIKKFDPDLVISHGSPEAARIAFGLRIKHVMFTDAPHSEAVMRLTLPFVYKLLTTRIIPKKEYTCYGIKSKDIIHYNAIDAAYMLKHNKLKSKTIFPIEKGKKTILIRMVEEQASYYKKKVDIIPMIKIIQKEFPSYNIVVIARYNSQRKRLKNIFGNKIKILGMMHDGKLLLENTDVFIGSGGTMTYESALMGIPTISYNPIPNLTEQYLVKKRLAKRETQPENILQATKKLLGAKHKNKKLAKQIVSQMDDPYNTLLQVINSLSS